MAASLAAAVSLLLAPGCSPRGGEPAEAGVAPHAVEAPGYVADADCIPCHELESERWSGSQHAQAMQVASEATVLGDFDDAVFEQMGQTTRFFRRDGRFLVETEGPDGRPTEFEIAYTFGIAPLQQYLVPFPGGRLQCLTIAWDTVAGRWFSLYPDERIAADDVLHWTGRYQNWNTMCAECHSTRLDKAYDLASDSFRTTWVELDVGCQACHGPGAAHVAWAGAHPEARYDPGDPKGLTPVLRRGAPEAQLDACAPCHSRRVRIAEEFVAGAPFLDSYLPERLHQGYYHADGQILEEVYVYGSFLQSKMHAKGVGCTDCHDPHTLELQQPGNAVCMQCHSPNADLERFPTLTAKDYDDPAHHFHEPDSEGAQCVACHMPRRTYMIVDPRRDHGFRVPRPDLTVSLGTPNACNDCHADQSAEWAAEKVSEWYGEKTAERRARPHFATAFAAARRGDPSSIGALAAVARDPEQAGIVRATALDLLLVPEPEALEARGAAVLDSDPLVRSSAVRGIETFPPDARVELAAPLLDDPVRAVRIEAARALAALDPSRLDPGRREVLERSLAEYVDAQRVNADMAWSHLNLGVLAVERGRADEAEEAYRTAIRLDPSFLPARFNLANLYNRTGRNDSAEEVLRGGIEEAPGEGELYYSLGLLLAEEGRMEDAAEALSTASRLLPERARAHHNLGLALQNLGRLDEAEKAHLKAFAADPDDPEILHALVLVLLKEGEYHRALPYAERLAELVPDAPGPKEILDEIRAQVEVGPKR